MAEARSVHIAPGSLRCEKCSFYHGSDESCIDPENWEAGDPCHACGSRDTGMDTIEGGYCNACHRSDSDE